MTTQTTNEMLTRLSQSKNYHVQLLSKDILSGAISKDYALKYAGGFMTAVLKGDYETALQRADGDNLKALQTI